MNMQYAVTITTLFGFIVSLKEEDVLSAILYTSSCIFFAQKLVIHCTKCSRLTILV